MEPGAHEAGKAADRSTSGPRRYVFGPVVSRRLGLSLGIDPVPAKTCNWNCVYCQLGRTVPLRADRREYYPAKDILQEAEAVLSKWNPDTLDWVTFVGSGETLLHCCIGWMVGRLKDVTNVPVAVITNGSLLSDPDIRQDLLHADAVLPSLDAGSPELFRHINRPHPGVSFEEHVAGLEAFSGEYSGELLLEVMLLRGLNDTPEALSDLAAAVERIAPLGVHLVRPDRPPAEPWVSPSDDVGFMRAVSVLGSAARVLHPSESVLVLESLEAALDTVLGVLSRHPLSEAQLERAMVHWTASQRSLFLATLERSPEVKRTERYGMTFWVSAAAHFPPPRELDQPPSPGTGKDPHS
jgi:wyosine [tRNA(Phe)-imidazoG37] synthetase (radical SAM superfamily)